MVPRETFTFVFSSVLSFESMTRGKQNWLVSRGTIHLCSVIYLDFPLNNHITVAHNCHLKRNNLAAKGRTPQQKERLTAKEAVLFTVFSLLELFFSRCIVVAVAKENLLDTPAIVSLANFQHIQML